MADPKRFYIFSAKHTKAGDEFLMWWRPKSAGYTWNLDAAGVYDEGEAREICEPSRGDCVAVPVEVARRCLMTVVPEFTRGLMLSEVRDYSAEVVS